MQNFRNYNQYLSFFQTVPTMDVFVKLKVAMDRVKHRRIHRNDTKDMVFLCVAVPYCNAIITERFWNHIVRTTGLASQYETQVETNLKKLPDLLENLCCF